MSARNLDTQEFADWVAPIASRYRESRAEAVRFARTLAGEQLHARTPGDGWSVRDELAHIASDRDFLAMLGAILNGGTPDTSAFADIDARNARELEQSRARSLQDIADALEDNGRALQSLLARVADSDESRTPEGIPFALKDLLSGNSHHDPYHLAQIREALAPQTEKTTG